MSTTTPISDQREASQGRGSWHFAMTDGEVHFLRCFVWGKHHDPGESTQLPRYEASTAARAGAPPNQDRAALSPPLAGTAARVPLLGSSA